MSIDDDGFVGIMTSAPTNALDVTGDINIISGGLKGATLYAESDAESNTGSTTYVTKVSLVLPASGTYIVFATAELGNDAYASSTEVRLRNTSTSVTLGGDHLCYIHYAAPRQYIHAAWVKRVTVDGTADTVSIQWLDSSGGGADARIRNARIFALRID